MMINVNDYIKVKLTGKGHRIHFEDYERYKLPSPSYPPYRPKLEDDQGWSRWQLWELMQLFGPHIGLSESLCFETEIEVGEKL